MATAATIDVLLRANTAQYRAAMIDAGRVANQNLKSIQREAASTAQSIQTLNRTAAGFLGFQALRAGVGALIDAQKSIQQIHYGLQAATGSAAGAEKAYAFVAQTAKEMGLDLQSSAEAFAQLSAAANANGVSMKDQQALFTAFAKSSTVLHLSAQQSTSALLALQQMFSKGKIQAQELRLQLGQAIPGAAVRFQNAVLQVTKGTELAGKSFDQLLQNGDLVTSRFLPQLVQALEETGASWEDASHGLNAELNRLSSAWFKLKAETSNGLFSDVATTSVRLMADNLDKVAGAAVLAGAVLTARVASKGISAGIGAAQDVAQNIALRQAETAATVQATAAVVAKTRAELVDAEAIATRARAAYGGSIAADLAAVTATKAHTRALEEHAVAVAADAAAQKAGTIGGLASRVGSGALSLVGGRVGAALLALGGIAYAIASYRKAMEDAQHVYDEQKKSLDTLKVTLADVSDGYKKGSVSVRQLAEEWNSAGVELRGGEERLKALQAAVDNYKAKIEEARTSTREGSGLTVSADYEGLQRAQDELAKFQAQIAPTRQKFIELEGSLKSALDPATFEAMRAAALRADDVKFQSLLAGLTDIQRQAFAAADAIAKINSAGSDAVWQQQIQLIKKTKGEYQAWLTEQGKAINAAGGVAAMTPEARKQFNDTASAMKYFINQNHQADEANKAAARSSRSQASAMSQQENQFTSITDRIKRQIALDKESLLVNDQMTASEKLRVIVTEELKSAKNKLSATQQKQVQTLLAEAVAQGAAAKAQQDAKKAAEDLLRLQYQLNEALQTQQDSNNIDLLGISRGGAALEQMRRVLDLQREYQRQVEELNQRAALGDITPEAYKQQLEALKAFHEQALAAEEDYQKQRAALIADWQNGVRKATEDYIASAADIAGQTNDLISSVYSGLEDNLTSVITKGKADWGSFLDQLRADSARFVVKQGIAWAAKKFLPAGLGGGNGSEADALSGAATKLAGSAVPLYGAAAALAASASALAAAGLAGGAAGASGGGDGTGGWGSWIGALGAMFGGGRAVGGPVSSGTAYLVGEQGPEIFVPRGSGRIVPAGQTAAMLGGGGGSVIQNNTFLLPQRVDNRSQMQVSQAAGNAAASALRRNGG